MPCYTPLSHKKRPLVHTKGRQTLATIPPLFTDTLFPTIRLIKRTNGTQHRTAYFVETLSVPLLYPDCRVFNGLLARRWLTGKMSRLAPNGALSKQFVSAVLSLLKRICILSNTFYQTLRRLASNFVKLRRFCPHFAKSTIRQHFGYD